MARRKLKGREVNGIVLLDKPKGISSNKALQELKFKYFAQKAGHTGSLDPLATGMLPICFGEATKFAAYLLNADKSYRFTMQLGVVTNTGDAEGEVIEQNPVDVSDKQLKKAIALFSGEIEQVPPMYSALKVNGTALYKLAREGKEVERKARTVTIFSLNLIERQGDLVTLEVHCSKGTYVRTLAEDIGKQLGCGAHISELRRLKVSPFEHEPMVSMEEIDAAYESKDFQQLNALVLPVDAMLGDYPEVELDEDMAYYVNLGQAVQIAGLPTEGKLRMYDENGQFMGMGRIEEDGKLCPDRLLKKNH